MINNIVHYVHKFHDLDSCPFEPTDYSKLKFGSKEVARKFGEDLAESFFAAHADKLMANDCVVIASPYNYIKNAATVMTQYFIAKLNHLMVNACGRNVEYTTIHRKVSYTADYGFLSKEKRQSLLSNDDFYINYDFVIGKTIIFVDDVKITGTHEDKLIEILEENALDGIGHFFLYYANYEGDQPDIESKLNFSGVKDLQDVLDTLDSGDYEMIIRPIKYVMAQPENGFQRVLEDLTTNTLIELYNSCTAEGYYTIPLYQNNFNTLRNYLYN
jgi:hypothetical protein